MFTLNHLAWSWKATIDELKILWTCLPWWRPCDGIHILGIWIPGWSSRVDEIRRSLSSEDFRTPLVKNLLCDYGTPGNVVWVWRFSRQCVHARQKDSIPLTWFHLRSQIRTQVNTVLLLYNRKKRKNKTMLVYRGHFVLVAFCSFDVLKQAA